MKRHRIVLYGLIVALAIMACYFVFVTELPKLIWISQRIGTDLSWQAVGKYLEHNLIDTPRADVHSLLNDLFWDAVTIHGRESLPACSGQYSEEIQMGNLFHSFYYIVCYSDDKVTNVIRVD